MHVYTRYDPSEFSGHPLISGGGGSGNGPIGIGRGGPRDPDDNNHCGGSGGDDNSFSWRQWIPPVRKTIVTSIAAAIIAVLIGWMQPAGAANCHLSGVFCGQYHNNSSHTVGVVENYGEPVKFNLPPGGKTESYIPDADQVVIPAGVTLRLYKHVPGNEPIEDLYQGKLGPGRHKLGDVSVYTGEYWVLED